MGMVTRWQQYARQYGAAGLVQHLAARLVRPVWERASVQLLVLSPPAPAAEARVPLRIGLLTRETAGAPNPEWEKRWSEGDVCYAAWRGDALVHHSWVARHDSYVGEVHGSLRLQPGDAYVYDCFTDGSCRGQGIFPAVLAHIGQELFRAGVHRIWIAVEAENRSSLKAIRRAGFAPAGEVLFQRLGPWVRRTLQPAPGAPSFHIE